MDLSRDLVCPLSLDLMTDPVMLVETGEIFERSAIQGWFDRGNATDPWTRQPLTSTRLAPVRLLRRLVEDWVEQRKQQQRVEEEQEQTRKLLGALEDDSVVFIPPERLTLGREIGSGGMGVVRAATLQPSGKEVAVKMLPLPVLAQDASMAFRREVKVLQRGSTFCHNVCRFLGVTKLENHLCIVMFKYEQSLEDVIKLAREGYDPATATPSLANNSTTNRGGQRAAPNTCIPYARLLLLAQDVCLAMADLHRQHIIVQDLKPGNVLIDAYGRGVVADFGISVAVEHTMSARKATSIIGSVHYMAPEQHDPDGSAAGVTSQADVWAFGCLLSAMATGRDPWEGLQMRQVITNVLVRRQTPPVPEVLPDALRDMVRQCFCFEPSGRPSFDEMLAVVREAWGQQSQPPPPPSSGAAVVPASPTQGDQMLPSQGEHAPSHALDWLSLQGQAGSSQGLLESAIRQQLRGERQQELDELRSELARKQEEVQALKNAHAEELEALKQELKEEKLIRTTLLAAKGQQGAANEPEVAVDKWMETYRCSSLNAKSPPPPPLLLAARTGRLDVVKHFVRFGVDLDVLDENGEASLLHALRNGDAEMAICLIKAGAGVKVREKGSNRTALHFAAAKASVEIVDALIAAGADVNAEAAYDDVQNETALHVAVEIGNLGMVTSLLKARALTNGRRVTRYVTSPPLHIAVNKGLDEIVGALLAAGADVNATNDSYGYVRETALHLAVAKGHIVLVERLIKAGARLDMARNEGNGSVMLALHIAANSGHAGIVDALLAAGADVNATVPYRGMNSVTALHGALNEDVVKSLLRAANMKVDAVCRYNNGQPETALSRSLTAKQWNVAALLLEAGAKVTADGCGMEAMEMIVEDVETLQLMLKKGADIKSLGPCLLAAAKKGLPAAEEALLRAGVDPNTRRPQDKYTALHLAIQAKSTAIVEQLLQAGANPNTAREQNPWKESVLCTAVEGGSSEIVKCLIRGGADLSAVRTANSSAWTQPALYVAVRMGSLDMVKCLLEAGADPNAVTCQDNVTEPVLYTAVESKNLGVVKCLVDAGADMGTSSQRNRGLCRTILQAANGQREMIEYLKTLGVVQ